LVFIFFIKKIVSTMKYIKDKNIFDWGDKVEYIK